MIFTANRQGNMGKERTHCELAVIFPQSPMEEAPWNMPWFANSICRFVEGSQGAMNYTRTSPSVNCESLCVLRKNRQDLDLSERFANRSSDQDRIYRFLRPRTKHILRPLPSQKS
ncbi:hypothetical protein AVEN_253702-1 [Araneus ventricosus]|uniref:Uncharacterized protein n=1 Tax=Araneus ventricosus TaxID=182803 RepID=A0A4Y2DX19_ARAVE|nr:hypothetical protein AVEN_253702-1 [Araneus ventricosus]